MKDISESIPEQLKKYVDSSQPKDLRLTVARWLLPLSPKELTQLLYLLTRDEDEDIGSEARKSLGEMPREVISTVLSDSTSPPQILDYFARTLDRESELQAIILNSSSDDSTISYLAETAHSQNLLELIARNHQRITRSSEIVEALSKNPLVSRPTLDGVIDYLRLCVGERADIPGPMDEVSSGGPGEEAPFDTNAENSFLDGVDVDQELLEESGEEGSETQERRSEHLITKLSQMTIGQKIKLAIMGNREARTTLVRDQNRIVSRAVLKNPRLTDNEIAMISQSKIVSEDILREISDNRRWTKMYPVKLALVNNPKTPPHISVNFIKHIRDFDLKSISWSKNLPRVITNAAKNVMRERRDRR